MIKQAAIGLDSRTLANPFLENGNLPLITAPMYSVVDRTNFKIFLDSKINVCMPRIINVDNELNFMKNESYFSSVSLDLFIESYCNLDYILKQKECVCIDTANGNMPKLHHAIKESKIKHGDNLVIIAGNVSSVSAFVELAKTGVNYIRVGVGGGSSCTTTKNTGVGQENLYDLIENCNEIKKDPKVVYNNNFQKFLSGEFTSNLKEVELQNVKKVKIIADGISSYIKYCELEYGFNDNGYAAINKLIHAGANLVMIGTLFAQAEESAGEKLQIVDESENQSYWSNANLCYKTVVKMSGMSTNAEQQKYKIGELKPSEGSIKMLDVRYTLNEWLYGRANQDLYPYISGFLNTLKSYMSYVGKTKIY